MRVARWIFVVAAVVVMTSPVAMASHRRAVGTETVQIEGLIKTVMSGSLVITTSHGDDVTVMLTDKTEIRHGETPIAAADLKVGERVHVKATQAKGVTTANEVIVQDENEPENETSAAGVVKSVGTDSLVVTTANGDVTVNVDKSTIIRMKDMAITLADIKVGDRVEAEGTQVDAHTILAKMIQVEEANEPENEVEIGGVVKSVGTSSLVVTTAKGDVTVNVDKTTVITKQGKAIALADIKMGDMVEAEGTLVDAHTLNATKIVDETENEQEAEIKGVVKSVGTSSLVVTTSAGDVTVQVDSNTQIRKDGQTIKLSDIKTGDHVEAEGTLVDAHTLKATKISVEDEGGD